MKDKSIRIIRLMPVVFFASVIPLLVRAMSYTMSDLPGGWGADYRGRVLWDVFSRVKALSLYGITAVSLMVFIFLLIIKAVKVRKSLLYIPMGAYLLCVLISLALSPHRETALFGGMNRFEGTLTICCYIFMLFYIMQAVSGPEDRALVMKGLTVTVTLECLIGLTQFLGHDILFAPGISGLISGNTEIAGIFLPGQVYQTVANMNYVPFYLSLLLPYFIFGAWASWRNKNFGAFAFYALLLLLIGINCYGAGSLGGVLGMGVSAAVFAVLLIPDGKRRTVIAAGLLMVLVLFGGISFLRSLDNTVPDNIITEGDHITVVVAGERVHIAADADSPSLFACFDDGGVKYELCPVAEGESVFRINKKGFAQRFTLEPMLFEGMPDPYLMVRIGEQPLLFHFAEDRVYFCNPYGEEGELKEYERRAFQGHFGFASGRGFIWSSALSMIGEHPFFGTGADTFMLVFPQEDYVGKAASGGLVTTVVDKAHNMYLQMGATTGLVSLVAFAIMILMVIAPALKASAGPAGVETAKERSERGKQAKSGSERGKQVKGKPSGRMSPQSDGNGAGVMTAVLAAGVMGFLVGGLTCDSTVSVMPVFYAVLGMLAARG